MQVHWNVPLHHAILLFVAAMLGGLLNSVAGGGGFIAFPALLFTGVNPINANATNTVAYRVTLKRTKTQWTPIATANPQTG